MLYRELNTVGGYLSPACGGGKITSTQFFLIDKGILQWCAKGIVIKIPIWLCIVPPPKAGEQYERTAILYHQQYTSKLGEPNKQSTAKTMINSYLRLIRGQWHK